MCEVAPPTVGPGGIHTGLLLCPPLLCRLRASLAAPPRSLSCVAPGDARAPWCGSVTSARAEPNLCCGGLMSRARGVRGLDPRAGSGAPTAAAAARAGDACLRALCRDAADVGSGPSASAASPASCQKSAPAPAPAVEEEPGAGPSMLAGVIGSAVARLRAADAGDDAYAAIAADAEADAAACVSTAIAVAAAVATAAALCAACAAACAASARISASPSILRSREPSACAFCRASRSDLLSASARAARARAEAAACG